MMFSSFLTFRHVKWAVLVAILAWLKPSVLDAQTTDLLSGPIKLKIHSKCLNEDRSFWVVLPPSYATNGMFAPQSYPVLYVLDGDAHLDLARVTAEYLSGGAGWNCIPELLVVGVGDVDRNRDFTPTHTTKLPNGQTLSMFETSGGAPVFERFLREELSPYVENHYRTKPFRILEGHSLGGLLALDEMCHTNQFYQGLIALDSSIWWDNEYIVRKGISFFNQGGQFNGAVYLAFTSNTNDSPSRVKLNSALKAHVSSTFRCRIDQFENDIHPSVLFPGLENGLRFVFDKFLVDQDLITNADGLARHFTDLSQKWGTQFLPPESMVNNWAYSLMRSAPSNLDMAMEFFKLNVTNYATSYNAYDSLAECLDKKGETNLALEYYGKSLKLNPQNAHAAAYIKEHSVPK
jgi:predicted alpha/beta superfamily hydrolase